MLIGCSTVASQNLRVTDTGTVSLYLVLRFIISLPLIAYTCFRFHITILKQVMNTRLLRRRCGRGERRSRDTGECVPKRDRIRRNNGIPGTPNQVQHPNSWKWSKPSNPWNYKPSKPWKYKPSKPWIWHSWPFPNNGSWNPNNKVNNKMTPYCSAGTQCGTGQGPCIAASVGTPSSNSYLPYCPSGTYCMDPMTQETCVVW